MVPFSRNKQFIGATGNISRLMDKIDGGDFNSHQRLALWGLGGVG
jgi:hypothetical protein